MPISPEGGPTNPERKKDAFISVNMDKATPEDYKLLEKAGWEKGAAHPKAAELDFCWVGEGEPKIPEEILDKVFPVTVDGKKEYIEFL
ncbi:MAG: hypothetical protein PHQ42_04245 [Patescibacteria group bacterium]|nr:hypothetical protein [Patescibacteria group bacterium]